MHSYLDTRAAESYLKFGKSPDGQIQRKLLFEVIKKHLPEGEKIILDAGCGDGWLVGALSQNYKEVYGCDLSPVLIAEAKIRYLNLPFEISDIQQGLPFENVIFDAIVLNLVLHNLPDQKSALKHLHSKLKSNGKLLVSIVNPYYGYPAGVWKRGLWGWLLRQKPKLKLRPYNFFGRGKQEFLWNKNIPVLFYPLTEQINNILEAGFKLKHTEELKTNHDSTNYDLQFRLYRYPLVLFFVFEKE